MSQPHPSLSSAVDAAARASRIAFWRRTIAAVCAGVWPRGVQIGQMPVPAELRIVRSGGPWCAVQSGPLVRVRELSCGGCQVVSRGSPRGS
ncbi:hypothetical protein ABZ921_07580 [Streptomyces atriruber]|uniref:Uncharacterized protein n=1 Tax=Streptomyces atriruber TaxID=545121 RepID=A0ABV3BHL5_9ACTN